MSLDLGIRGWSFVGLVDGHAMLTHAIERRSRWVDLRTWPGTLLPVRDEYTRAVCRGGALVGSTQQTVYAQPALDKRRTELRLPHGGFRAIGALDGKLVVVGDDEVLIHDRGWQRLGSDTNCTNCPDNNLYNLCLTPTAVVGDLVIWGGRVLRYVRGALVETAAGVLPSAPADPGYVPTEDGFITCGGGKLITVARHGERRDDVAIGALTISRVLQHDGRLLVYDGKKHHVWDGRSHAPLDLGSSIDDPPTLIAAPCGLVALAGEDRVLVRVRM